MSGIGHQKNVSASSKARSSKLCVRSLFIVVTCMLCYYCSYHVWIQPAVAIPKHLDTTTMEIKQPGTKYTGIALNPNNYKPNKDPHLNTTNCHTLLESYRMGEISQMKQGTEEYPIDKSYIRRTITSKPFYVSVHDKQIDWVRTDLFLTGRYYESKLSKIIQNVFDQKTQEGHSKTTSDHHDDPTTKTSPTKKSIMIDVGGNIGWFSLLAAAHGAEVFTFEPNVINMVRFCESQILNGWVAPPPPPPPPPIADGHVHDFEQQQDQYNRIHSYLKGVSYTHGAMQPMFQINANNPGSYTFSNQTVVQEKVEDGMLLPLITLDALAMDQGWIMTEKKNEDHATITNNQPSIGFLKIDVEGLELSVLKGATQLLNSGLVENIAMEFKINMGRKTLVDIVKILFDSGYVANEIGGWQGPSETLLSGKLIRRYKSPVLFIDDLLAKFVNADANVWFQLSDKNKKNNNSHSNP